MTRKTRNQAAVEELIVTATLVALGHALVRACIQDPRLYDRLPDSIAVATSALVDVETRAAERDRAAS